METMSFCICNSQKYGAASFVFFFPFFLFDFYFFYFMFSVCEPQISYFAAYLILTLERKMRDLLISHFILFHLFPFHFISPVQQLTREP